MGVGDTMGHPEAQEYREQSGYMGRNTVVPIGCHPGSTSPGVSSRVTLVSVRPDWHDTQLVPSRGSDIAVAETERVLQDRLSVAYVPASPNMSIELCLTRVAVHDVL